MACPFFYPTRKFDGQGEAVSQRVPLGEIYSGECRARVNSFLPEYAVLAGPCNAGYGRGLCEHFPVDAEADAVRFHIAAKTARAVSVQYIFERGCWPVKHGLLVYSRVERTFAEAGIDPVLERQAWAFLQSTNVGRV